MSVIDDVRKLLQELVAPDLKAISAKLESIDLTSKLRDDALSVKIDTMDLTSKLRDDALSVKIDAMDLMSKLRDDALLAKMSMFSESMDSKFQMVLARIDAQHATVMNALAIDKRLEVLERVQQTQH